MDASFQCPKFKKASESSRPLQWRVCGSPTFVPEARLKCLQMISGVPDGTHLVLRPYPALKRRVIFKSRSATSLGRSAISHGKERSTFRADETSRQTAPSSQNDSLSAKSLKARPTTFQPAKPPRDRRVECHLIAFLSPQGDIRTRGHGLSSASKERAHKSS